MGSKFPAKLAAMGYTEEGLEKDNPYNSWMGDFHHAMPRPDEFIRILASTYQRASRAFQHMRANGCKQRQFQYVMLATQLRGMENCRIFCVSGWSDLHDGPQIETLSKQRGIELVSYDA